MTVDEILHKIEADLGAAEAGGREAADRLAALRGQVAHLALVADEAKQFDLGGAVSASASAMMAALQSPAGTPATLPYWVEDRLERLMMLGGSIASRTVREKKHLSNLAAAEFRVYSQWGEDGIIDWLLEHVPTPNTRFVEFGVSAFEEANCRFLLKHRNWRGFVMDGSPHHMSTLRNNREYWMYDITGVQAFISRENINGLIKKNGFAGPVGILSIDLDGNDYWVWEAIDCVDPAIVICEYNPILGDTRPVVVPYDPEFERFKGHYSGLYFGASIAALIMLGKKKGFTFVGSCANGINAFFVRGDLAAPVLARLDEVKAFPSRHRDSRNEAFELTYTGGGGRFGLIKDQPVIDVSTGRKLKLRSITDPYSPAWLAAMA